MREDAEHVEDLAEVGRRVREIQAQRRGRIRWTITHHTAELALGALAAAKPPRRPAKSRRRKRYKRLL